MRRLVAFVFFMIMMVSSSVAFAAGTYDVNTITLRSRVEKSVPANMAIVTLGVRVEDNRLLHGQEHVNTAMNGVINNLIANGVRKDDIKTSRFTVDNYKDDKTKTIVYVINNNVTFKVRNLDKIGQILDSSFDAGANEMNGINFIYDGDETIKNELMKQAVINGRKQAEAIVGADGRTLGKVLDVNVYGVNSQMKEAYASRALMSSENRVGSQVLGGDITISAEVNLVFEILKP